MSYETLKELKEDHDMRVVSVRRGSDGVLLYKDCSAVGQPAIEIPHGDPHFADRSRNYASFRRMLRDYGCEAVRRGDMTYLIAKDER